MVVIENCRDAAYDVSTIPRQEEFGLGRLAALVERVFLDIEEGSDRRLERRYPVRVIAVNLPRQIDESRSIGA